MDETFRELNSLVKIRTAMIENGFYSSHRMIALEGRYNRATEKMNRLWDFLEDRGWTKAPKDHPLNRQTKTGFGWCHPFSREVSVKPRLSLGNQLYTMLHEVAHTLDLDELGYYPYMDSTVLGGFLGGEVRADTVAAMVVSAITPLNKVIDRSSDYSSCHNVQRPYGQQPVFPETYEDRIKAHAELLLKVVS